MAFSSLNLAFAGDLPKPTTASSTAIDADVSTLSDTKVPYAVKGGNIYYNPETGEIVASDSTITSADIPSEIDGVSITAIGNSAFKNRYKLESVTLTAPQKSQAMHFPVSALMQLYIVPRVQPLTTQAFTQVIVQ